VRAPQSTARSILKLKEARSINARCFLSLRSDRVIRVFKAYRTLANTSFRRTTTVCRARWCAPDVFVYVFSRISNLRVFMRRFLSI